MTDKTERKTRISGTRFQGVSAPPRGRVEPKSPVGAQEMALAAAPRPISAPKSRMNGVVLAYGCVGGLSRCPVGAGAEAHTLGEPGPQGLDLGPVGPVDVPAASGGLPGGPRAGAVVQALADFFKGNRGKRGGCRRANGAPAAPESAPLAARSARFPGESGHGSYPWTPRTAPAAPPAGRGGPAVAAAVDVVGPATVAAVEAGAALPHHGRTGACAARKKTIAPKPAPLHPPRPPASSLRPSAQPCRPVSDLLSVVYVLVQVQQQHRNLSAANAARKRVGHGKPRSA